MILLAFQDISERKQAEEALREADRRKDEFLATLAHELRGPLAPLRNMLEIMKRADAHGDLIQQARSTMDRQLGQMTRLIDDLLDVSRISRGRIRTQAGAGRTGIGGLSGRRSVPPASRGSQS